MSTISSENLSFEEKIVLDVVQEYLNRNRQFDIDNILTYIHSRFKMASINMNQSGIKEILNSLVKKNYLLEGSKLNRDSVLFNEKRRRIYKFILEHPGTYFNVLKKELHFNNYVITWHIDILEKFNFIKREFFDNRYIYFDSKVQFERAQINYFTSKEKFKKLMFYLQDNNIGVSKTQIFKDLKMHPNTINKYLDILERYNIIEKEKIENKFLYFLRMD